jgi:hypothetical protein
LTVGAPPGSSTKESSATSERERVPTTAIIACAVLGSLAIELRIRGAAGDLWLDEIWSVKLAGLLRQGQFLIEGLALDNNHYLNTLYLMLVGGDATPLVQRAFAIAIGTLTVPIAGYAMRRFGTAAMIVAMGLFALGYFFVNYGSEARGYAGLIGATLLAIVLVERALEQPDRRTTAALAIAAVVGFLFQPIMLMSLAILGAWVLWQFWRTTRDPKATIRRTWAIFMPSVGALLPLLVLLGGAVYRSGGYLIAAKTPFSFANFLEGYAGLYRVLLGIPDAVPDLPILAVPVATLLALYFCSGSRRFSLGVITMVLLPVVVLIVQPPNVHYPRYYLVSGVVFVLILAELFAIAWGSAIAWRVLAIVLGLGVVAGNAVELMKLFQFGRGDPVPALRVIADAQQPVLVDVRDRVVVEYLAPRHGLQVTPVDLAALCTARPAFMLTSDRAAPADMAIAQPGCSIAYRAVMRTEHWGLSGSSWTLYRAE